MINDTYILSVLHKFMLLVLITHNMVHGEILKMSCIMRKSAFCICKNKGADQLCGNRTADQHLGFRYIDITIPLLPKSEISSL